MIINIIIYCINSLTHHSSFIHNLFISLGVIVLTPNSCNSSSISALTNDGLGLMMVLLVLTIWYA